MSDKFTERIFIEYSGEEIEVFPMILHDKDIVTTKIPKLYTEEYWHLNLLDEQAYKTLVDLLYIALGKTMAKPEIEEKIDLKLSLAIINKFKEVSQLKNKKDNGEATEWKQLYGALLQNTSMNMQDILQLTIGQLEELLDGIAANNKTDTSTGAKKVLEGTEALHYLLSSGGQL